MDNEKIIANKHLRYPALRTISEAYNYLAYIIGVLTVIAALSLLSTSIWYGLIVIVSGALIVLGVFAVAESIKVFIDIEENTRLRNKE